MVTIFVLKGLKKRRTKKKLDLNKQIPKSALWKVIQMKELKWTPLR